MTNNLGNSKLDSFSHIEDEIDFRDLFKVLFEGKWTILATTLLVLVFSLTYSLYLPNIYKSEALLSPVDEQSNFNGVMGNYGGLASLAGINLPTQSGDANSIEALYKIKSLSFFIDHILPNIFLPNLMAIKSVDVEENVIEYDESIYDSVTNKWVKNSQSSETDIPSNQKSFEVFINKHLSVSKDNDTGYVTVGVKHQSPIIAQAWTRLIVEELNNFFRLKDKAEAQAAMDYLNKQISQTSYAEVKQVIAELMQHKTQQLTLIEVTDFYVFDYIDPPAIMEDKHEPGRALICLMGAVIGLIFGTLIVFIRRILINEAN